VVFDCSKLYISECLSHSLFYLPSLIASYSVRNGSALHAHGSAIFRIVVEHPTKSSLDHVGYASWKSRGSIIADLTVTNLICIFRPRRGRTPSLILRLALQVSTELDVSVDVETGA
jgi:hypothetical protein